MLRSVSIIAESSERVCRASVIRHVGRRLTPSNSAHNVSRDYLPYLMTAVASRMRTTAPDFSFP